MIITFDWLIAWECAEKPTKSVENYMIGHVLRADDQGCVGVADSSRRVRREKRTVRAMLKMYCRRNHASKEGLCDDCVELLEYSDRRLDKCPLIEDKPTCAKCPIHCYEKNHRERMKAVMRYSGPRMLLRHPVLAVLHMSDGLKKPKDIRKGGAARPKN